jgi:hypothetical protein
MNRLHLVGVQEVHGTREALNERRITPFLCGERDGNHQLQTGHFEHKRIILAIKRVGCHIYTAERSLV